MPESALNITIIEIISAVRLLNSPVGVSNDRHNRECWGLALKTGGKTIYTVDGQQILSDAQHPVLLPKGGNYTWKCIEPGECLIIDFDAVETGGEVMHFEVPDVSQILNAFARIERKMSLQKPNYRVQCMHLLYGILVSLAKSVKREYVSKDKYGILQPAINYIAENYYNCNITNDVLAKLCGISTVYFRKTFETVYGTSPIKYLHNFRIGKAKAMLLSDYGSVNQVAESTGYSSIYHFSKMFRHYTGQSPSEFAKTRNKS